MRMKYSKYGDEVPDFKYYQQKFSAKQNAKKRWYREQLRQEETKIEPFRRQDRLLKGLITSEDLRHGVAHELPNYKKQQERFRAEQSAKKRWYREQLRANETKLAPFKRFDMYKND